jgi:uncharacterized protein DUF3551
MPKRIGSGGWNNFRLLKIEAKPLQSEHTNQSRCEADGYISIRARFRKRNSVNRRPSESKQEHSPRGGRIAGNFDGLQHRSDFMAKRPTLPTTAGNRIGDNQNSIKAGGHGLVLLQDCQRLMKTIGKIATASAVAFAAFAFTTTPGSADSWSPATVPPGHYCISYDGGGTDCSFTSYALCEATASGQDAECYGNTPVDDQDPWNTP